VSYWATAEFLRLVGRWGTKSRRCSIPAVEKRTTLRLNQEGGDSHVVFRILCLTAPRGTSCADICAPRGNWSSAERWCPGIPAQDTTIRNVTKHLCLMRHTGLALDIIPGTRAGMQSHGGVGPSWIVPPTATSNRVDLRPRAGVREAISGGPTLMCQPDTLAVSTSASNATQTDAVASHIMCRLQGEAAIPVAT